MKKTLLIALSALSTTLLAQPTITGYVAPDAGVTDDFTQFDASALGSPGAAGANVTWDLSGISTTTSLSYEWKNASAMNDASTYPASNLGAVVTLGADEYWLKSSTEFSLVGRIIQGGTITENFNNDPREVLKFPLTYQTTYNETMGGLYVGPGLSLDRSGTIEIEADGYGTLIMPYGTINNVLRVKITTEYNDKLSGQTLFEYEDVQWHWYHPNSKFFLATYGTLVTITSGVPGGTTFFGFFQDQTSVGLSDNEFKPYAFNMFPNPASNQFTIQYDTESRENFLMEIFDVTGRMVEQRVMTGSGQVQEVVNVDHLEKGIYNVVLKYNSGTLSQKLIVN